MILGIKRMSKLLCAKFLSIAMLFVYVSSYYTVYPSIGNTMLIVSIIPVLLTYWAFNLYYAIGVQLLLIAHRFVAIHILEVDYGVMMSLSTILGTCLNFVLLFTVDYLYTLNKKLKAVERKLIQQNTELIIIKNKAEESDRLKSTFIANISHEIRTPLNAIIGFSHLLVEPNIKQEEKQDFFNNIKYSGDRLMQQIDSYIEMSNLMVSQTPLLESVFSLGEVMEDLYASAMASIKVKDKACIDLFIQGELEKDEDKVMADRNKLTQILNVLIDNAIKFTNDGYVKICYKIINETELMFSVEDTGIGISPQYKEIIFDCFRQGDEGCYSRKYEGSGLGLAISKASVELLGGKIWFTSTPGKGSTFFFTIPYKPVLHKKKILDMKFLTTN
ncbi:signal transduction histidine-protein kinase BarA [Saccharicrinis fermentans DSM 9555 = JCM 21142]|uniref:histidine kinase n=2 Tax=Saccharicrinis fermentans TaxID=982 RepID=W7YFI8_9BACT|nr:signal transduction histidine-protein kinase BarA [Saccharicrinis fermentans DSM 9555 = JCM 21142]